MSGIPRDITIEELLNRYPGAVKFLIKRNLPCLVCGEPTWGTLEELAREKQLDDSQIDILISEMNIELEGETAS